MRVVVLLLATVLGLAGQDVHWPELRGIVHLDGDNQPAAVLVLPQTNLNSRIRTAPGPRYSSILRVDQNDPGLDFGNIEVTRIDAPAGTVKLRHRTLSREAELKLTGASRGEKYLVHLERAPLATVIECYQRLSCRTIIHWPQLPVAEVDLHIANNGSKTNALADLARAIGMHNVIVAPYGEKFAFAIPSSQTNQLAALPNAPQASAKPGVVLSPSSIKFVAVDVLQVIEFYSDLCSRTVLRPNYFPHSAPVTLRSETPLNHEEAVWMIEAALRLSGLVAVPAGEKFVYVVPRKRSPDLPAVELKRDLPGTAGLLKLVDVDREQLLETYAALTGRKPLPVEPNVPHAKFSLRSHAALTPAEAAFALENIAILNGLTLEIRPQNTVALVPRALAGLKTN